MADSSPRTRHLSSKTFTEEFLTCRLCEELYNESDRVAKVLPCRVMHTLCKQCLDRLVNDRRVRCPFCTETWEVPESGFPNHYMLEDLKNYKSLIKPASDDEEESDSSPESVIKCLCCPNAEEAGIATKFCTECDIPVCQTCADSHKLMRQLKNHSIVDLADVQGRQLRKSRCQLHVEQDLTVYCHTCQKAVCHTCCALTEHDGHERIDLKSALVKAKRELRVLAYHGREQQEPLKDLLANVDAIINELNGLCSTRQDEINTLFDELGKAVKVQRDSAQGLVKDLCQEKARRLKKQKSLVEMRRTEYESACDFAEQACKVVNPIQLLSAQDQISSRLKDLIERDNNNLPDFLEPLENTHLPFHQDHDSVLQDFKQFISQFGMVKSTDTLPSHCQVTRRPSNDLTPGETDIVELTAGGIYHGASPSGGDPFQACLIAPDGAEEKCMVKDHGDGSYHVAYTPKDVGSHSLDIQLFGRPICGSPFVINVDQPVVPEMYPDRIAWLPAVAGFPHTITVYPPHDKDEDEIAKATILDVKIRNSTGHNIAFTLTKQEKHAKEDALLDSPSLQRFNPHRLSRHSTDHEPPQDVYLIQYTPSRAEQLTVEVKHNGQRLSKTPLTIDVVEISKEQTEISLGNPVVNQRWLISVLPKNNLGRPVAISHGLLKLNVSTLRLNKCLKIEAHHVTSDHAHIFYCIPNKVDIHQVDVTIHGESIHDRPLPVNVESWWVFPPSAERESFPTSVATSESGVIFLSDTRVGCIHVHNTKSSYSNLAVNLRKASSIAVDHHGRLLLLVPERKRVHIFEQGRAVMNWKCTRDNTKPVTIASSHRSNREDVVIIADASPDFNGLFLYKTDGTADKCISLSNNFIVEGQDSICVDDQEHIFICHNTRPKVVEFNFDGEFIREFQTEIRGQLAIACSSDGFILVSEKGRIVVFDRSNGFAKFKGEIQTRGDSYKSLATTNDGCVVALDVGQKKLVKYGYLVQQG